MPIGDADWLASTPEPTLEPELPICDAHHHLWEFRSEPAPYQRYLLPELAEDLGSGHNVRATVFIEVKARYRPDGPEDMRPVGEVEFVKGWRRRAPVVGTGVPGWRPPSSAMPT